MSTITENLQALKNFINENSFNLTDIDLERLTETHEKMKQKYNI